ncbi:MAG TPA: CAP domain-containing protein [Thermoanaerobaculia bacterium]|nr:CAP domain-containing protein [Thermoanaerobaculia bacterium]
MRAFPFLRCRTLRPAGALMLALVLLPAAVACSGSSPSEPGGGSSAAVAEIRSFNLLNEARREAGRPELIFDPAIAEVARRHSRRMRDEGFFEHIDPDGKGPAQRLSAAGIGFALVGENLATVTTRGDAARFAHGLLMDNAGHRANILDGRFTDVGVGVAQDGDTYFMTQVFVRR